MTYPYGVQIGVVRVDSDIGEATVERFLLANDIGRSINPMLVEGQLLGGFWHPRKIPRDGFELSVPRSRYFIRTADMLLIGSYFRQG